VRLPRDPRLLVVALGGRALQASGRPTGRPPARAAWARVLELSLPPLVDVAAAGFRIALVPCGVPLDDTDRRAGPSRTASAPPPLDLRAAEAQGAVGYGVQQALANLCRARGDEVPIAVVLTRVVVAADDPAFAKPTRAIGPPYSVATARRLARDLGWTFAGNGTSRRRVVPMPEPRRIPEAGVIRRCVDGGTLTIAAAGGGVPVVETPEGYRGIEAVLEPEATAALLGTALAADRLVFLTGVDRVEVGHRTARAIAVEHLSLAEARALLAAREFAAASIGPKVQAAVDFVARGGREAIITSLPALRAALDGRAGTRVVP
jgi:carbamate kinase